MKNKIIKFILTIVIMISSMLISSLNVKAYSYDKLHYSYFLDDNYQIAYFDPTEHSDDPDYPVAYCLEKYIPEVSVSDTYFDCSTIIQPNSTYKVRIDTYDYDGYTSVKGSDLICTICNMPNQGLTNDDDYANAVKHYNNGWHIWESLTKIKNGGSVTCNETKTCTAGSISLSSSGTTLSYNSSGKYYESPAITVSYSGISSYTPIVSGATNATIYNGNGDKVTGSTTAKTLKIRIPEANVTSSITATLKVSSSYSCTIYNNEVRFCKPYKNADGSGGIGNAQLAILGQCDQTPTKETKNISDSKSYSLNVGPLNIEKYDNKTNEPIEGIKFKLYKDANCTTEAKTANGSSITLTTDKDGKASASNLLYGTYYLKETKTKIEYKVLNTPLKVIIDGESNSYKIENERVVGDLQIEKYDSETKDLIEGIEFKLYTDATCLNEVTKNIYGEDIKIITKANGYIEIKGLQYGTYYLKETNSTNSYKVLTAPEKIKIENPINKVSIQNEPIELTISKKDITGTNELEGALIKITDATGTMILKEFYSTTKPTKFRIEKGIYILTEQIAPAGYMPVENSLSFSIDEHGKITILSDEDNHYQTTEDSITILNETSKVIISKQDITSTKELEGAKITVECDNGFKETWISGSEPKKFEIAPNATCTLKEEVSPKGYDKISTSLKFKVKENGDVEVIGTPDGAYYIDANRIIIYNSKEEVKVPDTGAFVAIGTILAGTATVYTGYKFIKPNSNKIRKNKNEN